MLQHRKTGKVFHEVLVSQWITKGAEAKLNHARGNQRIFNCEEVFFVLFWFLFLIPASVLGNSLSNWKQE